VTSGFVPAALGGLRLPTHGEAVPQSGGSPPVAPRALRPGARRSDELLDADERERNRLALRLAGGPLDSVTISGVQLNLNLVAFD
jgi:hypothetical protein